MESVIHKTIVSLETALRYNPENVELMTALAENYIRMGRLDEFTVSLCEKVLEKYPDNFLLLQSQQVSYVIEQTDQLDASLAKGNPLPAAEVLEVSITMLDEFLNEVGVCATGWFAWTRLCFLAGRFEQARRGMRRLLDLDYAEFPDIRRTLDWLARKQSPDRVDWVTLYHSYELIGDQKSGIKALERIFDKGWAKAQIGPILLHEYHAKYSPAHPEQVPDAIRPRFLQVLLDHGESQVTEEWLRKASLFGWQLSDHSKDYARSLIEDDQYDTAFQILQRMALDDDVKEMLNRVAMHYEHLDEIDEAVRILRYINNTEHQSEEVGTNQEIELTRNTEISLAELQVKNGRYGEALGKYICALCLTTDPDKAILFKIEDMLSQGVQCDVSTLFRLAMYFRNRNDYDRTISYLNRLLDRNGEHYEALHELESVLEEALEAQPESHQMRLERGHLNRRLERREQAIEDYKFAATAQTLAPIANRMLAYLYRECERLREALVCFQEIDLREEDLEPLYHLHLELVRGEDYRGAILALDLIRNIKSGYRDVEERMRQLKERTTRANSVNGLLPSVGQQPSSSGSDSENKMRDLIGDLAIGRYRYIDKVGSGGMGVVYKAYDLRLQKNVAIKILRDGLASSSKALDRFFREARIAAQIQHSNIVNIFDYNISSQDGLNYIVMEFVEGQSLREFIDLHFDDTISTSMEYITEMLYYMVQLFDALHATHAKGIIHRDIKPDNVMITTEGQVKITDFGIVHVEEATFTPTGAMLGTPRYMSPEQVTGARIDGRSDIYSVGIMLYEVLIGSPPFMTGDISYQQVNKVAVEPRLLNSAIPQAINNFILKCLEKKADNRFSDASVAKDAIREIFDTLGGCRKFSNCTAMVQRDMQRIKPRPVDKETVRNTSDNGAQLHAEPTANGASQIALAEEGDLDLDLGGMSDPESMEMDDLDLDIPSEN